MRVNRQERSRFESDLCWSLRYERERERESERARERESEKKRVLIDDYEIYTRV